jgi:hypothetical protein
VIGTAFHKWVRDNRNEIGLGRPSDYLPFKALPTRFTKADIKKRQRLYRDLAEVVWAPSRHGLA